MLPTTLISTKEDYRFERGFMNATTFILNPTDLANEALDPTSLFTTYTFQLDHAV
jgi:hypothetical protein